MKLMLRDPFLAEPFRLFDDVLGRVLGNGGGVTGWVPTLDVRETDEEYLVLVDLPGVKQEDVTVELENQVLSISGTRVPVEAGEAQSVRTARSSAPSPCRRVSIPTASWRTSHTAY